MSPVLQDVARPGILSSQKPGTKLYSSPKNKNTAHFERYMSSIFSRAYFYLYVELSPRPILETLAHQQREMPQGDRTGPRPYHERTEGSRLRSYCKGGRGCGVEWGPVRSPWGWGGKKVPGTL
jgi:hypothetical protein